MKVKIGTAAKLLVALGCVTTAACRTIGGDSDVQDALGAPASAPSGDVAMTLEKLRAETFARCQGKWERPHPERVPELDPTGPEGPRGTGLVYQEELLVQTSEIPFANPQGFWVKPKPRAAVNDLGMDLYVDKDGSGVYHKLTWDDANVQFPGRPAGLTREQDDKFRADLWRDRNAPVPAPGLLSKAQEDALRRDPNSVLWIEPPIDRTKIPEAGKVLTEILYGHRTPGPKLDDKGAVVKDDKGNPVFEWPLLFDIRSSGYIRFSGFGQRQGASMRVAAHGVFGAAAVPHSKIGEDFPVVRAMYTKLVDATTSNAMAVVESSLFCGVMNMTMKAEGDAAIDVDSYWYTRQDFKAAEDPFTGLIAYSSMNWKNEDVTPGTHTDEAHDSDTLIVN
jgi:hypothetical protein